MSSKRELPNSFIEKLKKLEQSYLSQKDPILQSGFSGGKERWRKERHIILDPITKEGSFLDVGCANGFLLKSLAKWAEEKEITLIPYGVDFGAGLINLAKKRFPEYPNNFWNANAWSWEPPIKFDYVYTLYDCVPHNYLKEYIKHLLMKYVVDSGLLIVGAYGSLSRNQPAKNIKNDLRKLNFLISGISKVGDLPISIIVWIKKNIVKNK